MNGFKLLYVLVVMLWSVGDTTDGVTRGSSNLNGFFDKILSHTKSYRGSRRPSRVDLVFVLDSSSSVGGHRHFNSLKTFIRNLVSEFSVSPSTAKAGLVLCSTTPALQFSLQQFVNKECTIKSIKQIKYNGVGRCVLGPSLHLAHQLTTQSRKMTSLRYQPKSVVIILSASQHDRNPRSSLALKMLRNSRTDVFFLYVGKPVSHAKYKVLLGRRYLEVLSPSELARHFTAYTKNRGLNQECYTKGITVYDECNRRCQCSNAGHMINCYRVRKDFTSMSIEERRLYIHALKTVSTIQPYKRVYDEITSYHPQWFDDVHQLKYFFPWHRWYILNFENFLRQVDCRVTVPYWDWSRAVSDGHLWRTQYPHDIWYPGPHALGGNGEGEELCVKNGPFRQDAWTLSAFVDQSCLTREFNNCFASDLPNRTEVNEYLKFPYQNFNEFEYNVRGIMHDNFHDAVGGVMSYIESANAPEFWFHHAFLDKTWADWQNRGLKFKNQFYPGIKSTLPGANVSGADYIDLSHQPMCIRVVYDVISDLDFPDNKPDPTVKEATPIPNCLGYEDYDEDYDDDSDSDLQVINGDKDNTSHNPKYDKN